jgi:hypothetical protein
MASNTKEFKNVIFTPPSPLNKDNNLSRLSNSEDEDSENDEDVMNFLGSAVKENSSNHSHQLSPKKTNNILHGDDSSEISSDEENSIIKDNDNDSYEAARNSVQQITERLRSRLL